MYSGSMGGERTNGEVTRGKFNKDPKYRGRVLHTKKFFRMGEITAGNELY
jgi:hypothetical protein